MKKEDKLGRIDIKATINKREIIDVEIQLNDEKNMTKRSEFYGARLITDQISKGDLYEEIRPVILINILNFNMLDFPEYFTKTVTVADKHRDSEVIRDITYYFIELPKFRKSKPRLANLLECWLALIDGENRGLIEMAEKKDKIIKEANEEVEEILSDEQMKALEEYRLTAIWEENSRRYHAEKEATERGMQRGMQKGMKQGIKEGEKNKSIEIAKKMKQKNIPLEEIIEITELTKDEIERL